MEKKVKKGEIEEKKWEGKGVKGTKGSKKEGRTEMRWKKEK